MSRQYYGIEIEAAGGAMVVLENANGPIRWDTMEEAVCACAELRKNVGRQLEARAVELIFPSPTAVFVEG